MPIAPEPAPSSFEAEYSLEMSLSCQHCRQEIQTVQVVRLLRHRVNFTSTLPRKGHIIICPSCRGILSANLGGM
ncbi:MAG TPA: hypothetical protein VJV23_15795 [Candidatus Polarisedimenticolia bacterium]|nr:hypothetical protein [Candidatus Polarisedimenticolia bacterium]